jgi:hypothetical protein
MVQSEVLPPFYWPALNRGNFNQLLLWIKLKVEKITQPFLLPWYYMQTALQQSNFSHSFTLSTHVYIKPIYSSSLQQIHSLTYFAVTGCTLIVWILPLTS